MPVTVGLLPWWEGQAGLLQLLWDLKMQWPGSLSKCFAHPLGRLRQLQLFNLSWGHRLISSTTALVMFLSFSVPAVWSVFGEKWVMVNKVNLVGYPESKS